MKRVRGLCPLNKLKPLARCLRRKLAEMRSLIERGAHLGQDRLSRLRFDGNECRHQFVHLGRTNSGHQVVASNRSAL